MQYDNAQYVGLQSQKQVEHVEKLFSR